MALVQDKVDEWDSLELLDLSSEFLVAHYYDLILPRFKYTPFLFGAPFIYPNADSLEIFRYLRLPIVRYRRRTYYEADCGPRPLISSSHICLIQHDAQALQSLPQAHVITECAVEVVLSQAGHPGHALPLIVPQLHPQGHLYLLACVLLLLGGGCS